MPYSFVAGSFHTKKLCSRRDFKRSAILHGKGRFAFLSPFWGLGAMYDDHLRLIEKRVVDFLLVLIELFSLWCYGWGATSEYQFKIGDFAPTGADWPKISCRRGCPHQPFFLLRKLGRNDLFSYGIKSGRISLLFCHNPGVWRTDRQTDGRTPFS